MKAAIFRGINQPLTIEQIDVDRPNGREVLVRTEAAGVCHSDLHFIEGLWPFPPPAVLGHEAAGIVEEVGDQVTYLKPGDHVISCLSVFCGVCDECLSGHPNRCLGGISIVRGMGEPPRLSQNGAPVNQFANLSSYAEKMLVHENALVKIADDIPLDAAALVGCGVLTGVGAALRTARVEPGSRVAVFGAGGVGLAAIQGSLIAGARMIIAVDVNEAKLGTAKSLGATHLVDASQGDPVMKVREIAGGGVDYSFEAIGLKLTTEQAFDCLDTGGMATLIGMVPLGQKVELDARHLLFGERKIQGSLMGSNRFRVDMPQYIEFYRQGRLKLDEMITTRMKLEDVNVAFRALKAGEVARQVLMFV